MTRDELRSALQATINAIDPTKRVAIVERAGEYLADSETSMLANALHWTARHFGFYIEVYVDKPDEFGVMVTKEGLQ